MRFNTASEAEIQNAEVADSYFHRTMQVLRARGVEDTPVYAEVCYKTSDPEEWFVVAGLDEVAHLLEDVGVGARAVPEGTILPTERAGADALRALWSAFAEHETAILGLPVPGVGGSYRRGSLPARGWRQADHVFRGAPDAPFDNADDRTQRVPGRLRRCGGEPRRRASRHPRERYAPPRSRSHPRLHRRRLHEPSTRRLRTPCRAPSS